MVLASNRMQKNFLTIDLGALQDELRLEFSEQAVGADHLFPLPRISPNNIFFLPFFEIPTET